MTPAPGTQVRAGYGRAAAHIPVHPLLTRSPVAETTPEATTIDVSLGGTRVLLDGTPVDSATTATVRAAMPGLSTAGDLAAAQLARLGRSRSPAEFASLMIVSGALLSRIGPPAGFLGDFGGPVPRVYATLEFQGEGGEDNPLWARVEMLAEMFELRSRPAPASAAAPRRAVQVLVDVTAGSPRAR